MQEQREITDKRFSGSVPQNPPAHGPQANGPVEREVQDFTNQMRAMKTGLEQTKQEIVERMVEMAPTLINRCFVGHDGKTPHEADEQTQQQGDRGDRRKGVGSDSS